MYNHFLKSFSRIIGAVMDCLCGTKRPLRTVKKRISSVYSREEGRNFQILECLDCKILQTSPFPTAVDLADLYKNNYAYTFHQAVSGEKSYRAKALLQFILAMNLGNDLIEFGSGSGILLNEAAKLNFQISGVELSELGEHSLPESLREKLIQDSAENFLNRCSELPSIVVMSHTLEHFLNPREILLEIHRKQSLDGILVLVVPNNKNFFNRYRSRFWGYWQVPVHTYHFNHDSLSKILEKTGFRPVKVVYRSGDFLSKGLFVTNLFKISGSSVPMKNTLLLVNLLSRFWHLFYRIGRSDLIMIAKKL